MNLSVEGAVAKIKAIFDEIHENNHPVGTRSWLHQWRGSGNIILDLLEPLARKERELLKMLVKRPKYDFGAYPRGIDYEEFLVKLEELVK